MLVTCGLREGPQKFEQSAGTERHGDHQSVDRRDCPAERRRPGAEYLLEVANVRKAFPGVLALDDVSFRLKRGHVHALMGENGAGKSTLMKIIAGIYTPDSGSFKLKGQEIKLTSPLDALRYGIAMIHQELNLMAYHDSRREHLDPPRAPERARLRAAMRRCGGGRRSLFERLDIPHRS